MSFKELVEYAVNGNMQESEVLSITEALKKEKKSLLQKLSKMPLGEERREGYKKLHNATMQLYSAKSYTLQKEGYGQIKRVYKPVPALGYMILCVDGK